MKKVIVACAIFLFFFSCQQRLVKNNSNSVAKAEVVRQKETVANVVTNKPKSQDTTKVDVHVSQDPEENPELAYLATFLKEGENIMDFEYGDLNKDEYTKDVILIGYDEEKEDSSNEMINDGVLRTTYILTRTADGKLKKEASNSYATMCKYCGGVFGDPYTGITIKNGYFSTEHYGGASWRWTQIYTFKYDATQKDWYLHSIGSNSYRSTEPEKIEKTRKTVKDFGKIRFADFEDSDS